MSHFSFGGEKCRLRCPKCRKQNMVLSEVWDGNGIYFTVTNGIMPDEADDHFQGESVRIEATCLDCKHLWTVRGVRSVYDLILEEEEDKP